MKRLLAGIAAACAAFAHAQSAPVTLYGRIYLTMESVEARGAPEYARRNRVSDQASYLGVRGTEDIGAGVKAFFQLETSFKADQNDSTFANRNSGVGVTGGFGRLMIGRWETPFMDRNAEVDPFGDLTLGAFTTAMQGGGVAGVNGQFDRRDQNVVQYWSPVLAGFELRLSYSANEGRSASLNPRSQGGSLTWTRGPVLVGYSYHELLDDSFGIYTNTAPVPPATLAVGSIAVGKQAAHALYATLVAGPVKLGAEYQEFRRSSPASPAVPGPATVVGFADQRAWLGSIAWDLGSHRLIYVYTTTRGGQQRSRDSRYDPAEPECGAHAVGWQYNFSRRTFVLAQYVQVDNEPTATCNFGFNTIAIAAGQDPRGISLGLRHVF
jgi:predicted porin